MQKNSFLMNFFLKLGLENIAWSFRRLHVPVEKKSLVLEVGSGGNPYFRSNVLIDAYYDSRERHYKKLISDRPIVLGFVENLPFKNNSFDFVIASHVLEHSKDPEKFLSEIQRVSRSGYIEVPDAFFERLACYLDHSLEITDIDDELVIRKKRDYIHDKEIETLFSNKFKSIFGKIASRYPFKFHVRYYWSKDSGGIKYKIVNPNFEIKWTPPKTPKYKIKVSMLGSIKNIVLRFIRKFFSQNKRNKNIDLKNILMCTDCLNSNWHDIDLNFLICKSCNKKYPIIDNEIIQFN